MKTKSPPTFEDVLRKKKTGYLVVRSDGCPPFRWRAKRKAALRDVDKARNAYGVRFEVFDCATKRRIYEIPGLGC